MKKTKTVLTVAVVIAMLATALSGCVGKNFQTGGNGNEKAFTYWCQMPTTIATQYQTMGEVLMYQELEKLTGVKIKFIHPPTGQEAEQFNLMIASKEYPDFIEYDWNRYSGGPDKAINDNVIIKLNDIIKEHAPDFNKQLTSNSIYDKQSKTDSGAYYGFPSLNVGKYRTFGGLILRKDWLDDLGLSVPETIAEWEIVLRAFKEKKGATAPFTTNAEIVSMENTNYAFNGAFNVGKGIYVDNGKIKFSPLEPGYKEYIIMLNKWYKEGLLDKDVFSNNGAGVDAKMTNGSSGATFGFVGGTMGRYLTAMKEKDPKFSLVAAQYPVKNKGDEPVFVSTSNEVGNIFLGITTACKSPLEASKWADYLYSDAGMMLKEFGLKGDTYNMVDGKPIYTDKILKNPQGLSVAEAMARNFRASQPGPGFDQNEDYLRQYYQYPQQVNAIEKWSKYGGNGKKVLLPPITPTLNESQELASLKADISTYVSEQVLKFVQGTEPIDKFDGFIAQLEKMNVKRFVELNQSALDRYNVR